MYDENLTKDERDRMYECIGLGTALMIMGALIYLGSTFMQGGHLIMYTFGLGLLTRPLSEKMKKLIERK